MPPKTCQLKWTPDFALQQYHLRWHLKTAFFVVTLPTEASGTYCLSKGSFVNDFTQSGDVFLWHMYLRLRTLEADRGGSGSQKELKFVWRHLWMIPYLFYTPRDMVWALITLWAAPLFELVIDRYLWHLVMTSPLLRGQSYKIFTSKDKLQNFVLKHENYLLKK